MPAREVIKVNDVHKEPLRDPPADGRRIWYGVARGALPNRVQPVAPSGSAFKKHTPSSVLTDGPSGQVRPQHQCWKLSVPHDRFASSVPDSDVKILRAKDVTIFFPVFDKYYAVKSFRTRDGLTVGRLLALVQRMAVVSLAMYFREKHLASTGSKLQRDVTFADVEPMLQRFTTCSLLVVPNRPGYKVYVMG